MICSRCQQDLTGVRNTIEVNNGVMTHCCYTDSRVTFGLDGNYLNNPKYVENGCYKIKRLETEILEKLLSPGERDIRRICREERLEKERKRLEEI